MEVLVRDGLTVHFIHAFDNPIHTNYANINFMFLDHLTERRSLIKVFKKIKLVKNSPTQSCLVRYIGWSNSG